MQKVVGSSPIIRSLFMPFLGPRLPVRAPLVPQTPPAARRVAVIAEPRLGNTCPVVDERRHLRKLHVRFGAPKLDDLRF
jgi:hypothetical protein